ncbi:MAG: flagellin [Alphaproteobacteria bacterium]|nr:flagellin [Alphaproteobacteria bacterium]
MTVTTNISTAAVQSILTSQLQAQQTTLAQLSEQLASNKKYSDLTDYAPSDALNLLNLQSSATQRQSYLSTISTVQTRLTGYDTTMTDMESIVSQAKSLAVGSPSYDASTASSIASLANNFLKSVSVDLNQQIGGRYIYAGSRYGTQPVTDLTTLTNTPSATTVSNPVLPAYDTAYTASQLTMTTAGQAITIGGTVTTPQQVSAIVNGTTYNYTVQSTDTTADIATGLAAAINVGVPGTTATGSTINVAGSATVGATSAGMTNTAAYATDSATIDSGYTLQYGVSSDNPAFQQMVSGLQFLQAAGNSTDSATYQANITQAATLLGSALSSIEALHTSVAYNTNTLTTETTTQNNAITALTNQVSDIQSVDITQVSVELNLLQTQLQASYSATGTIGKLSIVNYL